MKLESPQGGGGSFNLLIAGEAGQSYDVQTSSNLAAWTTVARRMNTTGTVPDNEPMPTNTRKRYYRAKLVP